MKQALTLLFGLALAASVNPLNAQNTVVTYQGRVTDNGTNFAGTGQFKFALVTSTNTSVTATANANLSGAFITSYTVTSGGSGYTTPPAVTISGGGGSGATATVVTSGGVVTAVNPVAAGSGYSSPPTVTIAPPPATILYTTYWSNDGTSSAGSEPSVAVSVPVTAGLFTVGLGNTALANMTALSATLFQQTNLQLRIWFNNGVNGFAALSPLQNLTAAPYANYAYAATTLTTSSNQPLNLSINGTNVLRITSGFDSAYSSFTPNSVGGYSGNVISNGFFSSFIGGGGNSTFPNRVGANYASVLGGLGNTASGYGSTVMGNSTTASGDNSTALGSSTTASGTASTALGTSTTASGEVSTAMGILTIASGTYSTTMGSSTTASGDFSTAMGYRAKAIHQGSFVWSGAQESDFASTTANQFSVRASGGVRLDGDVQLGTGSGDYQYLKLGGGNSDGFLYGSFNKYGDGIHLGYNFYANAAGANSIPNPGGGTSRISTGYGYVSLATGDVNQQPTDRLTVNANGNVGIGRNSTANRLEVEGNASKTASGSWLANSDARIKQNIEPVTGALEKLDRVRLVSFRYTGDYRAAHPSVEDRRYLNVVAQEFREVFPEDVKSSGEKLPDGSEILQVDTYPLTIYSAAAIQELNQRMEKKERRIQELETAVRELRQLIRKEPAAKE